MMQPRKAAEPNAERLSAEEALERNRERLRAAHGRFAAALLAAPVVVANQDRELRYTRFHMPALGPLSQEMLGKTDFDLFERAEDAARLVAIKRQVLRTREPARQEVRIFSDGEMRCYDLNVQPDFAGNRIMGVLSTAVDLTERKQVERRARRNDIRLRLALEAANLISFEWDIERDDDKRASAAASNEPLLRLDAVIETVHPEDRERFEANVRAAIASKDGRYESEIRVLRPDGELAWFLERGRIERDAEGRPLRLVGIAQDMTERKQTEQALRESEERFRALTEMSPDAVLVHRDGRYVYANPAALRLLGAERVNHVVGLTPFDIVAPVYHERVREEARFVAAEGRPTKSREARWVRLDGASVDVEAAAGPIVWEGKKAIQVVCRDISERKRIERALQEADRRKDEFLATLAHELRNPLAPIRNALYFFKRGGANGPSGERLLSMMERQVEHLVRLVDDLMEISRISRGKFELRKERCALGDALRHAIDTSEPHIQGAGQELAFETPSQPILLDADPVRLAQVFANLLNNASKYTESGGHIWVKAERIGDEAVVSVRDDGAGIAPETLPRVFELFTQNGKPGCTQSGLGVGLALVRTIVQLHGGSVEGRSDGLGRGSEFIVRLPAAQVE